MFRFLRKPRDESIGWPLGGAAVVNPRDISNGPFSTNVFKLGPKNRYVTSSLILGIEAV